MRKKIFEFIKKADFVLVFVFVLLGIIALGSALINDLLPFHRTRAQQIAVVEDVHVEIKEHLEFETNDKILNSEDDIALYVSDYDGTHVKEIASSIITFRFLGGEEILFSEYDGTVQSYFVYDCKTNVKTLIKSIKQEIIEKEIALYK